MTLPVNLKRSMLLFDRLTLVLCVLLVAIGGFLVFKLLAAPPVVVDGLPQDESAGTTGRSLLQQPQMPPFDGYLSVFSGRDIFQTDEDKLSQQASLPQKDSSTLLGWGTDYKLVGVILDKNPKAIVETLKPRGVQFLGVGDHLGEAVLYKVEENNAWFHYKGQEVELQFTKDP